MSSVKKTLSEVIESKQNCTFGEKSKQRNYKVHMLLLKYFWDIKTQLFERERRKLL